MTARMIAELYFQAWTSKDFTRAGAYLAEDLEVWVPINTYPSKRSFFEALQSFGNLVAECKLNNLIAEGSTAMIDYDMTIPNIGQIRVCEVLKISNSQISSISQIHDTYLIRQTGFGA